MHRTIVQWGRPPGLRILLVRRRHRVLGLSRSLLLPQLHTHSLSLSLEVAPTVGNAFAARRERARCRGRGRGVLPAARFPEAHVPDRQLSRAMQQRRDGRERGQRTRARQLVAQLGRDEGAKPEHNEERKQSQPDRAAPARTRRRGDGAGGGGRGSRRSGGERVVLSDVQDFWRGVLSVGMERMREGVVVRVLHAILESGGSIGVGGLDERHGERERSGRLVGARECAMAPSSAIQREDDGLGRHAVKLRKLLTHLLHACGGGEHLLFDGRRAEREVRLQLVDEWERGRWRRRGRGRRKWRWR
mmetsp:Transcript_18274/g.50857  ORF Transcript_18274/g.50857 Transcript_18274/m.50857 type:complete len:303 (-) Transcript_18274:95-1003(-)|eukprot:scaffold185184_cov29-Tisochrysis_lutea.AAC.1